MKTLFRYLDTGMRFYASNGDELIKRVGNNDRVTFCFECNDTVRLNAVVPGVAMDFADNTKFVHICPDEYVFINLTDLEVDQLREEA